MGYAYTYQGASGADYTFLLAEPNSKALPWQGGVVAFASAGVNPLSLTETDSIHALFAKTHVWHLAQSDGATQMYLHVLDDERRRKAALDDLAARYFPKRSQ